jgi:hypothetical protein
MLFPFRSSELALCRLSVMTWIAQRFQSVEARILRATGCEVDAVVNHRCQRIVASLTDRVTLQLGSTQHAPSSSAIGGSACAVHLPVPFLGV